MPDIDAFGLLTQPDATDFDRADRERLVSRLCRFLAPQGYLLTGHSESLNGLSVPLRCLRPSIYQSTIS